jgi:glutamyl-tRNA synthetase
LVDAAHYYLSDAINLDEKAAKKFLTPDVAAPLEDLIQKLSALTDFDAPAVEQTFAATLGEHGLQMGKLAQPVRVALTGGTVSPGIHDVIAVLGKERTIRRLRAALDHIRQLDSPH